MGSEIRPSPIAGHWYSSNQVSLARELDSYISKANNTKIDGEIVAILTPHAGYRYSGHVAGHAFAAIQHLHPDIVAVISPMHQPYEQTFLTSAHKYYWTPLGNIEVDHSAVIDLSKILADEYKIGLEPVLNDEEHSLEIELPFLQRIYPNSFTLLPVMVRDLSISNCEALGVGLYQVLRGKNAMVVVSTDLSHFYKKSDAARLDTNMLAMIQNLNPTGVLRAELDGTGFACGAGAVIAGLHYATLMGAKKGVLLKYGTSCEITGDDSSVVGYGAVALVKTS
jgi:AmmeMemoRadiSam system protein B